MHLTQPRFELVILLAGTGWAGGPPDAPEPRIEAGDAFWVCPPAALVWKTYYQTWMNGATQ